MTDAGTMQLAAVLAAGVVVGVFICWLIMRARSAALAHQLLDRQREVERLRNELADLRGRADDREVLVARLRETFSAVSQEALQSSQRAFLDVASIRFSELQSVARGELDARQKSVDELLTPIRERMDQVLQTMTRVDVSRAESHAALREQLVSVAESHLRLKSETENLVKALRAPQVRGRWGELQLRRVVEMAGMLPNCDFTEQTSVNTGDGRLRPDLIVRLPGDKLIVVDSKAPLDAYLTALECATDEERDAHLDRHARQVRDHITALAGKDYASQFAETPDFVVLFLPGETFFSEACRRDPNLIEYAVNLGVIPASPTTLITLLKAVAFGWQQERIARNAEELRDLGIQLHERIGRLADHFATVGKGLTSAVRAYNDAVGSLESRLLPTARKFRDLGAGGREEIAPLIPVDLATRQLAAPDDERDAG